MLLKQKHLLDDKNICRFSRRYEEMKAEEIGFIVGKNIQFVVDNALCHGCGTCYSVCPEHIISIKLNEKQGIYLPVISEGCNECGLCVNVCSGFELDLNEHPWTTKTAHDHPFIGPYASINRAYTSNVVRREMASSGGLVTEIIAYLFEKKIVDGAILVRMNKEKPLIAEGYIARSESDLVSSQKSKYCPVALNVVLRDIIWGDDKEGKYAYVGLPQHVHGLRLAQRLFPDLAQKIPLVVSIFTAHTPSFRATEYILYKKKINPIDVASIEYRGGGNPGRMRIVTKDSREYLVPHLHWMYSGHSFPLFFYPVRDWLYFDKISEWADISCGDNWMKWLREQKGASTVIARTSVAKEIIKEMQAEQRIECYPMNAEELVADQELRKKLNIRKRLEVWGMLGRKIPIYTRAFEKLPSETLRTLRFASYVYMCEKGLPLWFMDKVIKFDFFFRARPKKYLVKALRFAKRVALVMSVSKSKQNVKNARLKFVLIGGYGHDDIGDEAMPHGVRQKITEKFGIDCSIVMLSYNPSSTSVRHGVQSELDFQRLAPGKRPKTKLMAIACTVLTLVAAKLQYHGIRLRLWNAQRIALDELASCSAVINVGGGNLNSIMPSELYKKCTTYLICHLLGKPVYVSGQTIGPFKGWIDRAYARLCLSTVRAISFRDKGVSANRLLKIGVRKPVMFDAADDAISLKSIPGNVARKLLEEELGIQFSVLNKNLLIIANLKASLRLFKGSGRSGDLEAEVNVMARLCDLLVESYDCNIVFVGTDYSEKVDDRELHDQVRVRSQRNGNIFSLKRKYEDLELMGIISCADMVIGSRYHFNVFAAATCTPFLGVASGEYQRTKLHGLASLLDLPQCYFDKDMEFTEAYELFRAAAEVIESRVKIRNKLEIQVPLLRAKSLKIFDMIADDFSKVI